MSRPTQTKQHSLILRIQVLLRTRRSKTERCSKTKQATALKRIQPKLTTQIRQVKPI